MNLRAKLEQRVRDKQAEIHSLEVALQEARAYLQATRDALRMLPKGGEEKISPNSDSSIRTGTMLEHAFKVLKQRGKPMQAMELLKAMKKEQNQQNRQSLVGSIGAYARKGQLFVRTAPNTFGLLEWKQPQKSNSNNNVPDDFGLR